MGQKVMSFLDDMVNTPNIRENEDEVAIRHEIRRHCGQQTIIVIRVQVMKYLAADYRLIFPLTKQSADQVLIGNIGYKNVTIIEPVFCYPGRLFNKINTINISFYFFFGEGFTQSSSR
jgi:hypothetical protein